MSAEQLALDCEPDWDHPDWPGNNPDADWQDDDTEWPDDVIDPTLNDRIPTPIDLRRHEMWDLRGQGVGPLALWTAHNIQPGSYL
ncbi:hypothetical protein [Streptomyces chartreusis]|uniref:hypothetical protein n=1 Tax=Streptomyces chartreusis TaxID=1969 RepID=UPI002E1923BE